MFNVRHATVADATGISRVHVDAWKQSYRGIVPDDILDNLSVERRVAYWRQAITQAPDEYHRVFVGERGDQIVGFASYGLGQEKDHEYPGELFAIYILQASKREGLGRRLVTSVAEDLLRSGISAMLVWVLEQNPERGFYEHLGGVYLRTKSIEIGRAALQEVAYGWKDLKALSTDLPK